MLTLKIVFHNIHKGTVFGGLKIICLKVTGIIRKVKGIGRKSLPFFP